jgi:hypothetical protein
MEFIQKLLHAKKNLLLWPSIRHFDISMIDWLIIYSFTSRSRIFHLYLDVTNAGEGLQNLGLCSALRTFGQGGIFIVPHGTSVFPVRPIQSPFTTHEGVWRTYSNPDPHISMTFYLLAIINSIHMSIRYIPMNWKSKTPQSVLHLVRV